MSHLVCGDGCAVLPAKELLLAGSVGLLLIGVVGSACGADLVLPPVFADGMVLQCDMPAPVWGATTPGETVTVKLGTQEKAVRADADGRWKVVLDPLAAGGPFELVVHGNREIAFKDVLVGEVWLCSGQSNMQFGLADAANGKEAVAAARYPHLRTYSSTRKQWIPAVSSTAARFSAVAFFFGLDLHENLKRPVGLLTEALGGTAIQSWTSRPAQMQDVCLRRAILEPWDRYVSGFPARLEAWKEAQRKQGKDPGKMQPDLIGPDSVARPGFLHEERIAPLAPYALRGAVWYQGESDAWGFPIAEIYREALPALIADWRATWGQGAFPFLVIQLPNGPGRSAPRPRDLSPWTLVQETQWAVQKRLAHVYTAVTLDLGEADIHPKRKEPVGRRASLLARARVYGEKLVCDGPRYAGARVEDGRIRLLFDNAADGLTTRGDGELKGFTIAGQDRRFVQAKARIDGDTVLVWSDAVPKPAAARYAFAEACEFNLFNNADLPASPFRTDDWPAWDIAPRPARSATCTRLKTPPPIEGRMMEKDWNGCAKLTGFTVAHTFRPAAAATEARIGYDDKNLYVAIRCTQPEPHRAAAKSRDEEAIWSDDHVEIMVDPQHDRKTYYRFTVNPSGAIADGKACNNSADGIPYFNLSILKDNRSYDGKWNGDETVKTGQEKDAWIVTAAIPWSTLGLTGCPAKGAELGFQLTRREAATEECSEWALTGRDYNTGAMMPAFCLKGRIEHHAVSRFGTLVIE